MDTEKPSTRHFPGGIRDEPEERRHHDLQLNHCTERKGLLACAKTEADCDAL
jgi:hypothetical protein